MERETVISIRGLDNNFGDQVIHDNLDLDVKRGEILGVVGGSVVAGTGVPDACAVGAGSAGAVAVTSKVPVTG